MEMPLNLRPPPLLPVTEEPGLGKQAHERWSAGPAGTRPGPSQMRATGRRGAQGDSPWPARTFGV